MDDEDEMKNQCFGGEYMGEVSPEIFPVSHFLKFKSSGNTFYHSIHIFNSKSCQQQHTLHIISSALTASVWQHNEAGKLQATEAVVECLPPLLH